MGKSDANECNESSLSNCRVQLALSTKKDGMILEIKKEIYNGYTNHNHGRRRRQLLLANVNPDYPKQFIDVMGVGRSLIQLAVDRLKPICPVENMWVVTNEKCRNLRMEH